MINESDYYISEERQSSIFYTLIYSFLIISDFVLVTFVLIFSIIYLPEIISNLRKAVFANEETVLFSGIMTVFLYFSTGIFLFFSYKKLFGILFLSNHLTKYFYIKFLSLYYRNTNVYEFMNSYSFMKNLSNVILISSFLFSVFTFSAYSSMDVSGMNHYFLNIKYSNVPWNNIQSMEYNLILWYDQRTSRQKLREKFLVKGSFGELSISDYNDSHKFHELIQISEKYGKVKLSSDNPNDPQIRNFLNNCKKDEKDRIFKIYDRIQKSK